MTTASPYRFMPITHRAAGAASTGALVAGALLLVGCGGNEVQSALRPGGPGAREIADVWWILFGMGSLVFAVVVILTLAAIFARSSDHGPPLGDRRFLIASGLVLPAIILVGVLILAVQSTRTIRMPDTDLTIEVVGHQYWWEVRYAEEEIVIANELYVPAGRPVRLMLTAGDVIHSFWAPSLHGKMDLIPGKVNAFWIEADSVGRFRAQCAEYCGTQHANMALWIHAIAPDEFENWLDLRSQPATAPATASQARGYEVFEESGCDACHAIAGSDASGDAGPALTDIAARLTLGAGTIYNSRDHLADFIIRPQEIKPGNLMPDQNLAPADLEALLDYLESLQ